MTKKLILLSIFGLCALSGYAFADAPAAETQSKGPCGANCTCGCKEGKPCTCPSPKTCGISQDAYAPQANKGHCGANCPCGCQAGNPCTCPSSETCSVPQQDAYGSQAESYVPSMYEGEYGQTGDWQGCDCCARCNYNTNWYSDATPPPCYNPCRAPAMNEIGEGYDIFIAKSCGRRGIWMPEDPVLYRPMIADPRQICYSAGWRFNDRTLVKNVIDVSFGDSFPIYRWFNVGPWGGSLQVDIDGAVWVTFDPLHDSSPLMNADYFGGLPITYACGDWSYRLRFYHISCHIGDEFLLDHPVFDRRNASAEFVDFFASWDWTDQIRFYGGLGYVIAQDKEFLESRLWGEAGTEVRLRDLGFTDWCNQVYGEPIMAMHFRYRSNFKHHVDATYVLGYEWGKLCGLARKLRLYMEYHDGYSLEGQRSNLPTHYFSVRVSYGY